MPQRALSRRSFGSRMNSGLIDPVVSMRPSSPNIPPTIRMSVTRLKAAAATGLPVL